MFANDMTVTGINIQNIQTAPKVNIKKQTALLKMGRKPKLTFFQRRHTDGQQT